MRKLLRIIILLLPLFLAGCIEIDMDIVVKQNGKIDANVSYDFSSLLKIEAFTQKSYDLTCDSISAGHPTKPTSCEDMGGGHIMMRWIDIDEHTNKALKVKSIDMVQTDYKLDLKAFIENNFNTRILGKERNIFQNTGGKFSINVNLPGTLSSGKQYQAHNNIANIDAFNTHWEYIDDLIISSQDFNTQVELNGTVARTGMVDFIVNVNKTTSMQTNSCDLLEKMSFIKPNSCLQDNNTSLTATWKNFNGGNFDSIKINRDNFFLTSYEINIEDLVKNINPSINSFHDYMTNIGSNNGKFIINLEIPGSPILSQDFTINDGIVTIDLIKYYSNKNEPLIIKSTAYNVFTILALVLFIIAIALFGAMNIIKNKKGIEYYQTVKAKFITIIVLLIISASASIGYQIYLKLNTSLVNTYIKPLEKTIKEPKVIHQNEEEVAPTAYEEVAPYYEDGAPYPPHHEDGAPYHMDAAAPAAEEIPSPIEAPSAY